MPTSIDGKSTWEAYCTQFLLLAELNGWTEHQKAAYLAISLRGSALTVLTNLPEEQRRDYTALSGALQNRFGNTRQAELNRAQLWGRMKRREETLPELAEDVERLIRLAYPDAAEQIVIVLAKDQFIDALPDEETRSRIRQSRPTSLRQALEIAMELESYAIASKKAKQVQEVHLVKQVPDLDEDLLKQLEVCLKALQHGKMGKKHATARERRFDPMLHEREVSVGAVGCLITSNATALRRLLQQPLGVMIQPLLL